MEHTIEGIMEQLSERELKDQLIPPEGELWYDSKGRPICHVCGKAFNKLTSHVVQAHGMGAEEYKKIYGLNKSTKLTSKGLQEYFRNQPRVDIREVSHKTRFEDGHNRTRKRDEVRLQTLLNRPIKYKKKEKMWENT